MNLIIDSTIKAGVTICYTEKLDPTKIKPVRYYMLKIGNTTIYPVLTLKDGTIVFIVSESDTEGYYDHPLVVFYRVEDKSDLNGAYHSTVKTIVTIDSMTDVMLSGAFDDSVDPFFKK